MSLEDCGQKRLLCGRGFSIALKNQLSRDFVNPESLREPFRKLSGPGSHQSPLRELLPQSLPLVHRGLPLHWPLLLRHLQW